MTQLTISEAARLAGKSRTTLYRLLNSGELSSVTGVDSQPRIDVSELLRVFPGIKLKSGVQPERPPVYQIEQHVTPQLDSQLYRALQAQIDTLERLLVEKDQRIMLLEDMRAPSTEQPPIPTAPATPTPTPPKPERQRGLLDRLADGLAAALK